MQIAAPLRHRLAPRVIGIATACVFVASAIIVTEFHPYQILVVLAVTAGLATVVLYPIAALVMLFFLVPFHLAIFAALNGKLHLSTGLLDYWKDGLIVALFLRAVAERLWHAGKLRPPRDLGDTFLLVYAVAYVGIALALPRHKTLWQALGRDVEGPLLLLAVRFLRPTRRQLWACITAMLAAGAAIGGAALYERLGPHAGFITWYGAPPPPSTSAFYIYPHGYRSGSFLDSPLILAFYLAGLLPLSVAIASLRTRWRRQTLVAVAAIGAGLFVTITRSGYIGGGVGTLVVVALAVRNTKIRYALLGILLVLGGSAGYYYAGHRSETLLRTGGTSAHAEFLKSDINLIAKRPIGYGLGTTDALQQRFHLKGVPGTTESTFLAKALEGGVQALMLYLVALFWTLMRLLAVRRKARRAGDVLAAAVIAGAIGSLIGVALSGLFLGVQEIVIEVVLWGTAGVALAFPIVRRRTIVRLESVAGAPSAVPAT